MVTQQTQSTQREVRKQKRELEQKNQVYRKAKRSRKPYYLIGSILLVYLFFFCSNLIFPQGEVHKAGATKPGEAVPFAENRTVTLIQATYSPDQELMEIVLQYTNENYDNVNDYYYTMTLAGADTKGLTVNPRFEEPLITVLLIPNLPEDYRELTLLFAPKTVSMDQITDDITGTVVLNEYNVIEGTVDRSKTKSAYLKERLEVILASYEKTLQRQEKQKAKLENRIEALLSEQDAFQENKRYMTEEEVEQGEDLLLKNETELMEVREELKQQEARIKETKKLIEDAKETYQQI